MFRFVFAICATFGLACCMDGAGGSVADANRISGPTYFIAGTLGPACTQDNQGNGPSQSAAAAALARLDSNSQTYVTQLRQSTSLTPDKDAYEANWEPILFNSYAAAASGNEALARTIIDGMKRLAAGQRYQSEQGLLTWSQARSMPPCYANGPNSPCATHTPRFVGRMYANLLIAGAVLQSFMTEEDRATLTPWLTRGYRQFVEPDLRSDQEGIYDFANMGLARLAFAAVTNDMGLAQRELSERRRDFINRIEPSGYIDQNSYRGVRGLWYHTYGLDPALSYALIAREWGVDYFAAPVLGPRLRAAVQRTALGITDYAAFSSIGTRGTAFSTDPRDERAFVHQFALNIYPIAAREFGVQLPNSPRHRELSRLEQYSTISGMLARCYYSGR